MARAATNVRDKGATVARVARSHGGGSSTRAARNVAHREPGRVGQGSEVLSADLLSSAATRYSEMAGNASTEGWALRYLGSSRLLPHVAPPPLSPEEQRKLNVELADLIADAITAVLDGLDLSPEDWDRGRNLAMDALTAVTQEGWVPL